MKDIAVPSRHGWRLKAGDIGEGREPGHPVGQDVGRHSAEPENHQRPEHRLLDHSGEHLNARNRHRLDQDAAYLSAKRSTMALETTPTRAPDGIGWCPITAKVSTSSPNVGVAMTPA